MHDYILQLTVKFCAGLCKRLSLITEGGSMSSEQLWSVRRVAIAALGSLLSQRECCQLKLEQEKTNMYVTKNIGFNHNISYFLFTFLPKLAYIEGRKIKQRFFVLQHVLLGVQFIIGQFLGMQNYVYTTCPFFSNNPK